jgi:phosphatidyl-myo-inositol alpha-mannosyltransferase
MILTEAMAAGPAIAASDLDAFRRVLDGGRAGALFPTGDAAALTAVLDDLLDDPRRRAELSACARSAVATFDWPSVANRVLEVYATAIEATDGRVFDEEWAEPRPGS